MYIILHSLGWNERMNFKEVYVEYLQFAQKQQKKQSFYTLKYDFDSKILPYFECFNLEEDNRRQRFMTPTRNYSNYNNNINNNYNNINRNNISSYYSPPRNGGCRSCSSNSPNNLNYSNDYQRPLSGNYLGRQNNPYSYNNNIRSVNNDYNFRKRYDYSKFNGYQNNNSNFRNRYEDNKNGDIEENTFDEILSKITEQNQ